MPSKTNTKSASHENGEDHREEVISHRQKGTATAKSKPSKKDAQDCIHHWEDEDHLAANQEEYRKFKENLAGSKSESDEGKEDEGAKKRGRGANADASNKKQKKSSGGKHDEPNGSAGDKTRVPETGQKVQWKALPGIVDGEVVEVVYEEKVVEGKTVKASKEDPRIVLKSESSGKICIHKPEAVYFD